MSGDKKGARNAATIQWHFKKEAQREKIALQVCCKKKVNCTIFIIVKLTRSLWSLVHLKDISNKIPVCLNWKNPYTIE